MNSLPACAVLLSSLALLGSCSSTSGRVRSDTEAQLVGDKRAGTMTYDELVHQSTTKLVAQANMSARAQGPYRVALFGLETKGAEELRDHLPAIYEQIEEILVNAGPYTVLSRKAVDRARAEVSLRDFEDLFIAKNREAFNGVLGRESMSPDVLVYGTTTTQTTESSGGFMQRDRKERRYALSLEMIDAHTGTILAKVSGKQEIEYKH